MNASLRGFVAAACLGMLAACASRAPVAAPPPAPDATVAAALARQGADAAMAARVRGEFLHAWNGYRQYAWGHDALLPLSHGARDWYGQSLLMTPVDALDTLLLMGLDAQADEARALIDARLSFDRDIDVKHFEIVIRLLGGLLSSYEMTHDPKLLALADDLGTRLLPAFDSPTGLPYVFVNLRTGKAHGSDSNPAEAGSLLLEYGTLTRLTGKPVYYRKAKRALVATYQRRSSTGLVGERFVVDTGRWPKTSSHIGARIDSYYEYLWKCWKLFGDRDCLTMWNDSIAAANRYLPEDVDGRLWYGQVEMATGARTGSSYGALDAFMPGLLAYSGDIDRAARLQASSLAMWRVHGIEPETYDYRHGVVTDAAYPLRPEIVESTWYLYRTTGDPAYRAMGRELFDDFVRYTRTDAGFAALDSVVSKRKADDMESFVLAETFKYFYLLYASPDTLDLSKVVLNTEAHPLQRAPMDAEGAGHLRAAATASR
jgi:hypothetical protein